jgi:hypothetical protein
VGVTKNNMSTLLIMIILLIIAFLMAFGSMKDIGFASEIRKFIEKRKVKGSIVFFEKEVKHYSSSSK